MLFLCMKSSFNKKYLSAIHLVSHFLSLLILSALPLLLSLPYHAAKQIPTQSRIRWVGGEITKVYEVLINQASQNFQLYLLQP